MNSIYKEINYIYWSRESKLIHLTQNEFIEKMQSLKDYKFVSYSTARINYIGKVYSLRKEHNYLVIYMMEKNKYVRYTTNYFDNRKNDKDKRTGPKAIQLVSDKFEELTGTTMKSAFDTVPEFFKRCIPKSFYYTNSKYMNREFIFSSIDASSHYPASMRGRLPDAHTYKKVEGTVEPTEEYPFAFYIKSGHCAEYGVFDTHNWFTYSPFEQCLFRMDKKNETWLFQNVPYKEDETVLMKASEYEMTDVWNHFYKIKETYPHDSKEYQDAKDILNSAIGMMHTRTYKSYRYAHLVAVALCRANQHILETAYKINPLFIAQIAVDGIIYLGSEPFGTSVKQLGNYYQEFTGAIGKISSINRYIMMQDGKVVKFKASAVNRTVNGDVIDEKECKSLDYLDGAYSETIIDFIKELQYEEKIQEKNENKNTLSNIF